MVLPDKSGVALRYPVSARVDDWQIPEGNVPESVVHDQAAHHLRLVLQCWIERTRRRAAVGRNLAIRFIESHPQGGDRS